jgi:hypothetical protein
MSDQYQPRKRHKKKKPYVEVLEEDTELSDAVIKANIRDTSDITMVRRPTVPVTKRMRLQGLDRIEYLSKTPCFGDGSMAPHLMKLITGGLSSACIRAHPEIVEEEDANMLETGEVETNESLHRYTCVVCTSL